MLGVQSIQAKNISNPKAKRKRARPVKRTTRTGTKTKVKGRKRIKNPYIKGYSLERYCVLTLEFNNWHVKRNFRSWGVEDVIATKKGHTPLYIQAKNYQDGSGLDQDEQHLFLWHAEDYGCIPIYLSVPKRGQRLWLNLIDNKPIELYPFTKEWVQERSKIKKLLSDLKNPKKGGSRKKWKRYVMDHYQQVKQFIC